MGRVSTFRVIDDFGSWKHTYYFPNEGPMIRQLGRRFIGGKNGGHKLSRITRELELRKPTDRMLNEPFLQLNRLKCRSTIQNRAALRRSAKELVEIELAVITELKEERRILAAAQEEVEQRDAQECLEEMERERQPEQGPSGLTEQHLQVLRSASQDPQGWGFYPDSY